MLGQVILFSVIAGSLGTGLGGILGIIIKRPSRLYIALLFAIASGAMLGIVFFELLPESSELGGLVHTCIGLAIGIVFIFLIMRHDKAHEGHESHCNCPKTDMQCENKNLFQTGMLIFIAVTLHNLPEGLMIGAGARISTGLLACLLILLHNIPDGMAMASSLKVGGMKAYQTVGICFLSGLPTILGAVLGFLISTSDLLIAYSLAIACGAILCIVFIEMLPTVYEYSSKRKLTTALIIAGAMLAIVLEAVI